MKANQYLAPLLGRMILLAVVSIALVMAFSELSYRLFGEDISRKPTTIELIIPSGTSERINAGEDVPEIPEEMIFVVGDTLLIKNHDETDHQLGPVWIPRGSSASLKMDQKQNLAYTCSFQASRYLGLNIKEAITWKSRLGALGYAAPPTFMFLLVYSIVLFPLKLREQDSGLQQIGT